MVKKWIITLLMVALSLAACMPITPTGQTPATAAPTEEDTPAPDEEATAEPAGEATEEATEEEEATAEPEAESAEGGTEIQALVSQILAQELQIDVDEIEVVSVEEVEWPDACLGVYSADVMCAQVITPGYRVVLEANGQQYEYHTNLDGSSVQLFVEPEASIGEVLIEWQQTLDTCQMANFGGEGVLFGACVGEQMGGKLVSPERESELADFIATYSPFEAETPAGIVNFHGQGSTEATPGEQRMIAEWARQAGQEAAAGRSAASLGLALAWHREGGFAGFCDDLSAYVTGQLYASSCKSRPAQTIARRRMTVEELTQLYTWIDEYAPFEYNHSDGAVADSMTIALVFSGAGSTPADETAQQEILRFAEDLYAEMTL